MFLVDNLVDDDDMAIRVIDLDLDLDLDLDHVVLNLTSLDPSSTSATSSNLININLFSGMATSDL